MAQICMEIQTSHALLVANLAQILFAGYKQKIDH